MAGRLHDIKEDSRGLEALGKRYHAPPKRRFSFPTKDLALGFLIAAVAFGLVLTGALFW